MELLNSCLDFVAKYDLIFVGGGVVIAVVLKFGEKIKPALFKPLFWADVVLTILVYFVACVKEHQDSVELSALHTEVDTLKPKPLKERLIACLNNIDPIIITDLKKGGTRFGGDVPQELAATLNSLAREPESSKYIKIDPNQMASFQQVPCVRMSFTLSPELLK